MIPQSDLTQIRRLAALLRTMLSEMTGDLQRGTREEPGALKLNLQAIRSARFDFVVPANAASQPLPGVPPAPRQRIDYPALIHKVLDPEPGAGLVCERSRRRLRNTYRKIYFQLLNEISAELQRAAVNRRSIARRCPEDGDVAGQAWDWARGVYHLNRLRLCGLLLVCGWGTPARRLARSSVGYIDSTVAPQ